MRFLDKVVILRDVDNNEVCIFVDKVVYIKEVGPNPPTTQVGMSSGVVHKFHNETICSFLRMIKMGCEGCDDVQ
tara:strand:- start:183 stop:404 length:222 start_codon:yes stop_codon:yes gene_type:complete